MDELNNMKIENEELKQKLLLFEKENQELKEHLKKYTAPSNMKKYYKMHTKENYIYFHQER